ncbi:MAG: exodeoxyribonuclease III, partial [Planctomycetota bacterium]|nr:exodeoxyribonuclease III [Planctomycetota bacterium]
MTWNVNGLRSALKKGLPEVLQKIRPQVVLLQEVRAFPEDLPSPWANPPRWHVVWNPAEKPGYSGTAIWSRTPIEVLERGLGGPDQEGRVLVARTGGIVVGCLYLPSGSSSEARQTVKDRMLVEFTTWAEPWRKKSEPVCLAGDFNVAPTERDIY